VVAITCDSLCTFEFRIATKLFGPDRPELNVDWYDFCVTATDPGPLEGASDMTMQEPWDLQLVCAAGTIVSLVGVTFRRSRLPHCSTLCDKLLATTHK
jgi:AraC family transcriptional activator FtrA